MSHFFPADILLPKKDIDKWAVVACDQYTSEPEYWDDVERIVGDKPSALNIILPEVFLKKDNTRRIEKINRTMEKYIEDEVFDLYPNSMVYIERQSRGTIRKGVVGVIDLEEYDYKPGSRALIRATEQTVIDRLPPRIEIRKNAPLEMPHILLLIDDPGRTVIEPLKNRKYDYTDAYKFKLMKHGGNIHGWFLDEKAVKSVQDALDKLIEGQEDKMLFAVGDGNHSLATAKECYTMSGDPLARYALVEIVNIHDESIQFEPIYRVLFNVDERDFIEKFEDYTNAHGTGGYQLFNFIAHGAAGSIYARSTAKLPIGTLQSFIDIYAEDHPKMAVDYIHGADVVAALSKSKGTLGFIFDGMSKSELFPAIRADGSLPRKTFSMGRAEDKRFYVEARKIK